jgi:hypothetical protein
MHREENQAYQDTAAKREVHKVMLHTASPSFASSNSKIGVTKQKLISLQEMLGKVKPRAPRSRLQEGAKSG